MATPQDWADADESRSADSASSLLGGPDFSELSEEDRQAAEQMIAEMAEVRRQIVSVPANQIVANHLVGLYELATAHLSQPEPNFAEASLAIDAVAAVLNATEGRLGESEEQMRQALVVVQTLFVRRKDQIEKENL